MSSERVIQAAVYTALTGNAPYMALVSGIYDGWAPQGTAYDYTVLGATTENADRTHDKDGYNETITIHDWSSTQGKRALQLIREARNTVLHHATLSVSGWGLTKMSYEFGEVMTEVDGDGGVLYHQVTRYRVRSIKT